VLFRGRHFRDEIIVLCVRWYLRYPLSYRDVEEMMAERGLTIDHSTIARWVLRYAPVLNQAHGGSSGGSSAFPSVRRRVTRLPMNAVCQPESL
jgi:transposase-like protein